MCDAEINTKKKRKKKHKQKFFDSLLFVLPCLQLLHVWIGLLHLSPKNDIGFQEEENIMKKGKRCERRKGIFGDGYWPYRRIPRSGSLGQNTLNKS